MAVSHTPPLVVAASGTFKYPDTTQGWRPTSVTTQPASMAMTEATPATALARRNHFVLGRSRRKSQEIANQAASNSNRVAIPTIRSHARWTVLTSWIVGRASAGVLSRPWMEVLVPSAGSERNEASPGILMPPTTCPLLL